MNNIWDVVKQHAIQLTTGDYDCILLTSPKSITYVLNQVINKAYLMINKDNSLNLFISYLDAPFVKAKPNLTIHVAYARNNFSFLIKKFLQNNHYQKVAIEAQEVTYTTQQFLKTIIKKLIWLDTSSIRRTKRISELKLIKKAIGTGDLLYTKIRDLIKKERTNLTELAIGKFAKLEAINLGGELAFDIIVASGPNGKLPHARPTKRKLKEGELITIDVGIKLNNYCSDLTRMLALGKISDQKQQLYDYVFEAQKKAVAIIKAGTSFLKVHQEAVTCFKKYGLEEKFPHSIGHGLGMDIHEPPFIAPKADVQLLANDVITIEPGLYDVYSTGARIEDTFLITKQGCEQLSKATKELII